jgi:hypothetical protein
MGVCGRMKERLHLFLTSALDEGRKLNVHAGGIRFLSIRIKRDWNRIQVAEMKYLRTVKDALD